MLSVLLALVISAKGYSQDKLTGLIGPYLGQQPPGLVPKAFAPGIVTTKRWEYGGTFSPDMQEFYLLRDDDNEKTSFVVFQNNQQGWRDSVISPRVGQPFISPDGNTMHLGKRFKTRTQSGWSEIKPLDPLFDQIRIMRMTASAKGTYVFDEVGNDGDGVLRYSTLVEGQRQAPRPFGKTINSGSWNAHPFIAPDESYLIWDGKRPGGYGNSDIYISFRQANGVWGDAINLGEQINTSAWEASASVTPDGKYLFFNRMTSPGNVDVFWVDAQVIKHLKSKQQKAQAVSE